MQPRMQGTTARCGTPAARESITKKRAVHRSNTMKCAHPASRGLHSSTFSAQHKHFLCDTLVGVNL